MRSSGGAQEQSKQQSNPREKELLRKITEEHKNKESSSQIYNEKNSCEKLQQNARIKQTAVKSTRKRTAEKNYRGAQKQREQQSNL